MKLFEKILVATGLSDSSENLISNAIGFSKAVGCKIVLVHVLPFSDYFAQDKKERENQTLVKLQEIAKQINKKEAECDTQIIVYGSVSKMIWQTADKVNSNVIMISSGSSFLNTDSKISPVTELVIKESNVPVFVVMHNTRFSIKRILCPVSYLKGSDVSLMNALYLARVFNAEVEIINVCKIEKTSRLFKINTIQQRNDGSNSFANEKIDSYLKKFYLESVKHTRETKLGYPAIEILKSALVSESSLILMGVRDNLNLNWDEIGSTTLEIIRLLPTSCILFKHQGILRQSEPQAKGTITSHFDKGSLLLQHKMYHEALNEFLLHNSINKLHIPSINAISECYDALGEIEYADRYRQLKNDIIHKTSPDN